MIVFLLFLQVKIAYVNFVNHCYVDTEVEMKEIYASNHIWKLFENFLVDMARVSSPAVKYYWMVMGDNWTGSNGFFVNFFYFVNYFCSKLTIG